MSQGLVYTINMSDLTILANATLVFLRAATAYASAGSQLEVMEVRVGQRGTDTSDQLGIIIGQKVTAFGTYVAATPSPNRIGAAASAIAGGTAGAAATCGVNASVEGAGAVTPTVVDAFNNLNGWLYVPVEDARPIIGPDLAFVVKLVGTPATLTNWYASLTYKEMF